MAEVARRYVIRGIVQGVGFRYFAQRRAEQLGVCGYVKNLPDGRVEVYAIGPAAKLEELRQLLEIGPRSARVTAVEEHESDVQLRYARSFSIEGDFW